MFVFIRNNMSNSKHTTKACDFNIAILIWVMLFFNVHINKKNHSSYNHNICFVLSWFYKSNTDLYMQKKIHYILHTIVFNKRIYIYMQNIYL